VAEVKKPKSSQSPVADHKQWVPLIRDLESVLDQMLSNQEVMLKVGKAKRDALRRADREAVTRCLHEEHGRLQELAEFEKRRLYLVGELTLRVRPGMDEPMRLLDLAEALPEPERSRLLIKRQTLRERAEEVRHQAQVSKQATQRLMLQLQGLVQAVGQAVNGVSTYGNRGGVSPQAMELRTLNVTA